MASTLDFVQFAAEQADGAGDISYKKMFGEFMLYVNAKPLLLICDDTVFVKVIPETTAVLGIGHETGAPYKGAKPHYVLDPEDRVKYLGVIRAIEAVTPVKVKKLK